MTDAKDKRCLERAACSGCPGSAGCTTTRRQFVIGCGAAALSAGAMGLVRRARAAEPKSLLIPTSDVVKKPVMRVAWGGTPLRIGTERQLFLDDEAIQESVNLKREQGEPVKHPGNPVLRRDKPWEAARCELYGSAVWNPERKRLELFYSAMKQAYQIRMAYATSTDGGATWVKPALDLFPFNGTNSNIVYRGRYTPHGPSVWRDEQEADPARRYKLLTADYPIPGWQAKTGAKGAFGLDVAFSPDGLHWTSATHNPVIPAFISDTGQCVFRDPVTRRHVGFVRMWSGGTHGTGQRCVGRVESADFETWTQPELVYAPTPEDKERGWQFYGMSVTPYRGLYVGLVWAFPATGASADWNADTPVTWPELCVSRDSRTWRRVAFGQPFLPLGPKGSFDHRQIRTASSLVVLDDRILLLYAGSPHPHVSGHNFDIGLATLRSDGFAAMAAGEEEGRLLTRPLEFDAGRLRVNATVQPGGYVKAELLAADGKPLAGYTGASCRGVEEDTLSGELRWGQQVSVPAAPVEGTRIRLDLKRAKLYSFWVEPR